VPPGRYALTLARGTDWRDEDALFGPDTQIIVIEPPLEFRVTGAGRKSGYLLDLRGGRHDLRGIGICQTMVLDPDSLSGSWAQDHPNGFPEPVDRPKFPSPQYNLRSRFCLSQE